MNLEDLLYPFLSLNERLPRRLKSGIGWSYRHLPRRVRLGSRYSEFRALANQVESWPATDIVDYQLEQLRAVLVHAATHSPFYGHRFAEAGFRPDRVGSFDDLAGCPYMTKDDLIGHLDEIAAAQPSASARLYMTTGGSTGTPVGFYLHKGMSRPKEQAFLEAQWRRAGYFDGARLAVIRGHVTTDQSQGRIASYDSARDWLMLSSSHLTPRRLPEYLAEITRFRPDILHAYPSAALLLAEYLQRDGTEWPVQLRCVLAGSERLTAPQKRLLERTFGCRVYTWYGHSERAVLAGEGRTSDMLYFWPVYGYVEFGPPDAEGLQEVIGTSFHNLAMPLIRYRTGDYVRVCDEDQAAEKEFDWPAVVTVEGRQQEFLVTGTGRRISLTAFNMHDNSFDDLYALQFFQEEAGRAELRYVAGPHFDTASISRIELAVKRKVGDDLDVVLRRVDHLEKSARGKGKWLVSTLSQDGIAL
jgi:phenylacetate-CoA ligase